MVVISPCCCCVGWILKPPNPLRPVVPNPVPNPVVPEVVPVPSPEENPKPLFCVFPNRLPLKKEQQNNKKLNTELTNDGSVVRAQKGSYMKILCMGR